MSLAQAHQDPGITRNRRRDQPNAIPRIRLCQGLPGAPALPSPHPAPPQPGLRALIPVPREAADCHDQHKPTQPAPGRRIAGIVPYEQNPQVRAISPSGGRRPQTRTCGDSVGTPTGRSQPSGRQHHGRSPSCPARPGPSTGHRPGRGKDDPVSRPTTPAAPASKAPCTKQPATAPGAPATVACPRAASTTCTWPARSTCSGCRHSGPARR